MGNSEKLHKREKEILRVTGIGSIANFLLLTFKFAAGFLGHSSAMIADAVHSLSDFVTDIIVIVFVRISGKPEDESHRYGHGKYETLATAIIGIILFVAGVGILIDGATSIAKVIDGQSLQMPAPLALVAAAVSIVIKEVLYRYTAHKGKALDSKAVIANAWHHRSDAFSSIATFTGICAAICLGEKWSVLDPIAAVAVSAMIIKTAIALVTPCVDELLERSLPPETEEKICNIILSFPMVASPHHLRTRRIGNHIAIEVHIRMDGTTPLAEAHSVACEIEKKIKEEFGSETHIGIHLEPFK
ncbi:MAG: cation transporter [Bacteroidaceae bacterium]|nr:cation transporter [Bacteroidaceae bacterium]